MGTYSIEIKNLEGVGPGELGEIVASALTEKGKSNEAIAVRYVDEIDPTTYDLHEGDVVCKWGGYKFLSQIVAVFENRSGDTRVVCESLVIPGLLHIFSPTQLVHFDREKLFRES